MSINMNIFVIILRYLYSIERLNEFRDKHVEFLNKYYDRKIFLLSGVQNPKNGRIIIAKANNRQEISEILTEDPFYYNKLAEFSIYEFQPGNYPQGHELLSLINLS